MTGTLGYVPKGLFAYRTAVHETTHALHNKLFYFTLCLLAQLDSHKQQMTYMHELNAQYLRQKCMNDSHGVFRVFLVGLWETEYGLIPQLSNMQS